MIRIPFLGNEVYGIPVNNHTMIWWISLVRPKWKAGEVKEMGISKAVQGLFSEVLDHIDYFLVLYHAYDLHGSRTFGTRYWGNLINFLDQPSPVFQVFL